MPRFRSTRTGVVVSVDDATATRLGAEYERLGGSGGRQEPPADPEPAKPKPRGRTVRKP